jgi:hypothetical protein
MSTKSRVAAIVLGLTFVAFGLDGVLHFFPLPPLPERASFVIGVLLSYRIFYAVKALEVTSGLLLLSNRFVTLALCLLAPILFNIVWFDANLDPRSLPVALTLGGLEAYLLWTRRQRLWPLLAARS